MLMASATDHVWKFGKNSTALQVVVGHSLEGKYAIVTGSNTGIGLETARALVSAHCHVVLACRDLKKASNALDKIKAEFPNGKAEAMRLDLGSLGEVKKFADAYLAKGYPLHVLVLNAGLMAESYNKSSDGYESTYHTNHLAQMHLTNLLESKLVASAPSRVVVVSSAIDRAPQNAINTENLNEAFFVGSADGYNGLFTYGLSKCLNVPFARELHKHFLGRGVSVFYVHPGFIQTNLQENTELGKTWLQTLTPEFRAQHEKTVEEGAATSVFCAVEKDLEAFSGRYFTDCKVTDVPAWLTDDALAKHLWTLSETLIAKAAH